VHNILCKATFVDSELGLLSPEKRIPLFIQNGDIKEMLNKGDVGPAIRVIRGPYESRSDDVG